MISRPPNLFNAKPIIAIVRKYIDEIPAQRPSKPSIKFIAFVIPTIHITVINVFSITELRGIA